MARGCHHLLLGSGEDRAVTVSGRALALLSGMCTVSEAGSIGDRTLMFYRVYLLMRLISVFRVQSIQECECVPLVCAFFFCLISRNEVEYADRTAKVNGRKGEILY